MFNDPAEPEQAELSEPTNNEAYEVDSAIKKAMGLNFLAALVIPRVMEFMFPPMFVYFWQQCQVHLAKERGFSKLALGIPRGHAKTTFLKLLIVFIILFTKRKFIMVLCATEDLAQKVVADVVSMLDSTNIRKMFGAWDTNIERGRTTEKIFTFRGRKIILVGIGQGGSVRGIQSDMARPDVMIFDDSQTKDCAMSATQATQYASWFRGDAMKAKSPKACFFLYVGNIYPKLEIKAADSETPAIYGCMLKNLKQSTEWESIIVGAILEDGTALWEDLQSIEQLLLEYKEDKFAGQEATFLAEVMNDDEAIDTNIFDETKVPDYPFMLDEVPQGKALIIDPSLGKKKSDNQMVGEMHAINGQAILRRLKVYQMSAPKLVEAVLDWCIHEGICAIVVENYGYQETLKQWFDYYLEQLGIESIQVLLVNKGRTAKVTHIRSMLKEVMGGRLWIHPEAKAPLYAEVRVWDPMKTDNADGGLDVASYCNDVLLNFPQEILTPLTMLLSVDSGSRELYDPGMGMG